jgi:hypothetical protein
MGHLIMAQQRFERVVDKIHGACMHQLERIFAGLPDGFRRFVQNQEQSMRLDQPGDVDRLFGAIREIHRAIVWGCRDRL